jgi:hypothetical protein
VTSGKQSADLDLRTKLPVKTELHCHSGEFEIEAARS